MTTYRMRDDGYPFMKIMVGRKWVGRVYRKKGTGRWEGKINRKNGDLFFEADTKNEAFEGVTARALGFESSADLQAHNKRVRRSNRERRQEAEASLREAMGGDFDRLMNFLK